MHIILEGADASGKSTLARELAAALALPVQASEGPPKYPGEINERVRKYNTLAPHIFDRHPVVSQLIYGQLRTHSDPVDKELIEDFYKQSHIFIYCYPTIAAAKAMLRHVEKDHDTPQHTNAVLTNYEALLAAYDKWALRFAHINYRIGDSKLDVLRMVTALMQSHMFPKEFDPVRDIEEFHRKFGLVYGGPPRILPTELAKFRINFIFEEAAEYEHATALSDREKQFDALIDLMYVTLGAAHLHGFPFREGWARVHTANMKKVRAMSKEQSLRGSTFDVVKPPNWTAPSLTDLV